MTIYHDIISQILEDLSENSQKIAAKDEDLLEASKKEESECGPQYDRRDRLYADLLESYIKVYESKCAWNKWFKLAFFVMSILIFSGIVVVSLASLWITASKKAIGPSDVAVVVSGMAGIISAIIVLPRIIAEHLFPTNEDENMIGMVKNMQVNDSKIRSFYRKR